MIILKEYVVMVPLSFLILVKFIFYLFLPDLSGQRFINCIHPLKGSVFGFYCFSVFYFIEFSFQLYYFHCPLALKIIHSFFTGFQCGRTFFFSNVGIQCQKILTNTVLMASHKLSGCFIFFSFLSLIYSNLNVSRYRFLHVPKHAIC